MEMAPVPYRHTHTGEKMIDPDDDADRAWTISKEHFKRLFYLAVSLQSLLFAMLAVRCVVELFVLVAIGLLFVLAPPLTLIPIVVYALLWFFELKIVMLSYLLRNQAWRLADHQVSMFANGRSVWHGVRRMSRAANYCVLFYAVGFLNAVKAAFVTGIIMPSVGLGWASPFLMLLFVGMRCYDSVRVLRRVHGCHRIAHSRVRRLLALDCTS